MVEKKHGHVQPCVRVLFQPCMVFKLKLKFPVNMNLLAQSQAITLFFRKAQFNISAWLLCGGRFSDESEKQKKKKNGGAFRDFIYLFYLFISYC